MALHSLGPTVAAPLLPEHPGCHITVVSGLLSPSSPHCPSSDILSLPLGHISSFLPGFVSASSDLSFSCLQMPPSPELAPCSCHFLRQVFPDYQLHGSTQNLFLICKVAPALGFHLPSDPETTTWNPWWKRRNS